MKIVGVDLSLTGTGIALVVDGTPLEPDVIHAKLAGLERMRLIAARVMDMARGSDLVAVEGPSYASTGGSAHERAGLWWMVADKINKRGIPIAVVPPACLKKYSAGQGNAPKDAVLAAAVRRFPNLDINDNNAADALWLAAIASDHHGQPPVAMPAHNRTALQGIKWP